MGDITIKLRILFYKIKCILTPEKFMNRGGQLKRLKNEREKIHIQNSNRVQTSVLVALLSGSKNKK